MSKILTGFSKIEEAEESQRQFLVEENGKIFYDPSGLIKTVKNLRDSENSLKAKIEDLSKQTKEPAQESKKSENKENIELQEMMKRLQTLEESLKQSEADKSKLLMNQDIFKAAEAAGFDHTFSGLYSSQFGRDQKGLFVLDVDGTPKIDPKTGDRLSPAEFFKGEILKNPKLGKEPVTATGTGHSFSASSKQIQVSEAETKELKKLYNDAVLRGDANAVNQILDKAITRGIKI